MITLNVNRARTEHYKRLRSERLAAILASVGTREYDAFNLRSNSQRNTNSGTEWWPTV